MLLEHVCIIDRKFLWSVKISANLVFPRISRFKSSRISSICGNSGAMSGNQGKIVPLTICWVISQLAITGAPMIMVRGIKPRDIDWFAAGLFQQGQMMTSNDTLCGHGFTNWKHCNRQG